MGMAQDYNLYYKRLGYCNSKCHDTLYDTHAYNIIKNITHTHCQSSEFPDPNRQLCDDITGMHA